MLDICQWVYFILINVAMHQCFSYENKSQFCHSHSFGMSISQPVAKRARHIYMQTRHKSDMFYKSFRHFNIQAKAATLLLALLSLKKE